MANEATLLVETHAPISVTVADNAGIEKGAILTWSGANTVVSHDGTGDASFAGIAAAEKIANDGNTHIPMYRGGIFKVTANAAVTSVGAALALDAVANKFKLATAANVASDIAGCSFETCNAQNDVIRMEVRPGFNNNAYA